jgi:hypothetical protein
LVRQDECVALGIAVGGAKQDVPKVDTSLTISSTLELRHVGRIAGKPAIVAMIEKRCSCVNARVDN